MPLFARNPEKLEAKALDYERRGKTAKAAKYRTKAAKLRGGNIPAQQSGFSTLRTPAQYEQNALKWEQRGNYGKAQKNREKVWRMQNPTFPVTTAAPAFYDNNRFLGYNAMPAQGLSLNKGLGQAAPATIHHVLPTTVETHVHPTLIQQTTRPEKIVEVQPIVHREIEAPQVHVIEKHSYEQVRHTGPGVITNKPIVEETIRPRVIEEIQPVVHREVPAPFVERVEQHVTEHITKPTTMTKDVINERPLGMAAGAPLQQGLPLNQGLNQGLPLNQGLAQPGLAQPGLQQPLQPGLNNNLNNNLRH